MRGRKQVAKQPGKAPVKRDGAKLPLLEAIEGAIERRVRQMLENEEWAVSDLMKIRDVVREILAERPHEVVVRWVDTCEGTDGKTETETNDSGEVEDEP
jgi:hypothetical protein